MTHRPHPRTGRRRPLLALLAAAVALAACSDPTPAEETTTTVPPPATSLRVVAGEWPRCLNPLTCDDEPTRELVFRHVLPKLLEIDETGQYVPSPVLDGEPEVSVDPETGAQRIVYRLDPEARWHDGRPITSSDVRATWQARIRTPDADARGYDRILEVDDRDPLVAVVTLSTAVADWRDLFGGHGGWLLQGDAFGPSPDLTGRFRRRLPFGAGPFELVSFGTDVISFVAREDHWDPGRAAKVDRVRIEQLEAGATVPAGVDVVLPDVPARQVPEHFDVAKVPTTEVVGVFFDQRTPPLAEPAVRAAIDAAVDRNELLELVVGPGTEVPPLITCAGWLPAEPGCDPTDLEEAGADPATAHALLSEAGWTRGEAGVRQRAGQQLVVDITHDPALPRSMAVANAIRFRLRAVGIIARSRQVTRDEWRRAGRQESTGIGVFAVGLGTPGRLDALYSCAAGPNRMAWCHPDAQALLAELRAVTDLAVETAHALGDLAAEARAWLPLHQRRATWWVDGDAVSFPPAVPLGSGPLGALHDVVRMDT